MKIRGNKVISLAMAATFAWTPASCLKYRDVIVPEAPEESRPAETEKKTPEEIAQECRHNLINLDAAVDRYRIAHYGRYPETMKKLVPDYINYIPGCPLNKALYRLDPSEGRLRAVYCPNGHQI